MGSDHDQHGPDAASSPEDKIRAWLELTRSNEGHLKAGVCPPHPSPPSPFPGAAAPC